MLAPTADLLGEVVGPSVAVLWLVPALLLMAGPIALLRLPASGQRPRPSAWYRLAPSVLTLVCASVVLGMHVVRTEPSADRPLTDHLSYWWDADRSAGHWVGMGDGVDDWAGDVLGPDPTNAPLASYLPHHDGQVTASSATTVPPEPPERPEPPEVEVLGSSPKASGRQIRLRVHSPRGAPTVRVFLDSSTEVRAATVAGNRLVYPDGVTGWWLLASTVPRDGLVIRLHVGDTGPLTLRVVDATPGLPAGAPRRPPDSIPYSAPLVPEDSSVYVVRRVYLGRASISRPWVRALPVEVSNGPHVAWHGSAAGRVVLQP